MGISSSSDLLVFFFILRYGARVQHDIPNSPQSQSPHPLKEKSPNHPQDPHKPKPPTKRKGHPTSPPTKLEDNFCRYHCYYRINLTNSYCHKELSYENNTPQDKKVITKSYHNNYFVLSILLTVLNKLPTYQVIWSRATQKHQNDVSLVCFLRVGSHENFQRWMV